MTSFFWSTLLLVATGATGARARKEFSYDVILFGVPCYWLLQVLQVLQLARSSSMTSFFWSTLLLVATSATGAQLARSSSMTSFFWSTLLLVATGATGFSEKCYVQGLENSGIEVVDSLAQRLLHNMTLD